VTSGVDVVVAQGWEADIATELTSHL